MRQIAAELGVTEKILHRWKRERATTQTTNTWFAPGSGNPRDAKLDVLRKENKKLKADVEFLKKQPRTSHSMPSEVRGRGRTCGQIGSAECV